MTAQGPGGGGAGELQHLRQAGHRGADIIERANAAQPWSTAWLGMRKHWSANRGRRKQWGEILDRSARITCRHVRECPVCWEMARQRRWNW